MARTNTKMVVDCGTGAVTVEPLTVEEAADLTRLEAVPNPLLVRLTAHKSDLAVLRTSTPQQGAWRDALVRLLGG